MAINKRFKLKFPRVISSFQFCRPKHNSTFRENPIRAKYPLALVNGKASYICYPSLPAPPPSTPEHYFNVYASSKIISIGCGCRSKSCTVYFSCNKPRDFVWDKDAETRVAATRGINKPKSRRIVESESITVENDPSTASPSQITKKSSKKKHNIINKEKEDLRSGITNTAMTNSWSLIGYEGEEDDDSETLLSYPRSFSNDYSYEFIDPAKTISEKLPNSEITSYKKNDRGFRSFKRHSKASSGSSDQTAETESSRRGSASNKWQMIPSKAAESLIMAKKSEEPYEDFKRSMLEMILEKEMFETKDLEELLQCFLSLNSRQYHEIILEAFSEIWEVLFCDSLLRP